MKLRLHTITLSLIFFIVLPLTVTARDWKMDRAHSNIYFSVDHIFSKVRGHFDEFSAQVSFDEKNLEQSTFQFVVKSGSVNTNLPKRDKHLQSKDFFSSGNYPDLSFVSTSVTDRGEGRFDVAGKLSVKGKEYDFVLPMTLTGIKGHPAVRGKDVIGFDAAFDFDRIAYGVGGGKFADMGIVGRKVRVLLSLELLGKRG